MPNRSDIQILRDYLNQNHFRPQDKLPPERELAEELGLTRSRLRTNLAKLEREGIIWRHVGQGTFMGPSPANTVREKPNVAEAPLETSPAEILEARLCLEPQIAFFAAQRAKGPDLQRIHDLIEKSRTTQSVDEWKKLNWDMHLAIAQAAGNHLMLTLLLTIQQNETPPNWGELSEARATAARRDAVADEHHRLLQAIRARQPHEAAALMRQHLEEVRTALMTWLGPS